MSDGDRKWGAIKRNEKTGEIELLDFQKELVEKSRKYYVKFQRFFLESVELNYILDNTDDIEELNDLKKVCLEMSSKFCEITKDILDVSHNIDFPVFISLIQKTVEDYDDN